MEIESISNLRVNPRTLTYDRRGKSSTPILHTKSHAKCKWILLDAGAGDNKVYLSTLEGWNLGTTGPYHHYVEDRRSAGHGDRWKFITYIPTKSDIMAQNAQKFLNMGLEERMMLLQTMRP